MSTIEIKVGGRYIAWTGSAPARKSRVKVLHHEKDGRWYVENLDMRNQVSLKESAFIKVST